MLWTLVAVVLVLWLLGLVGSVGDSFVHLLLFVALVVVLAQFRTGRRGTA